MKYISQMYFIYTFFLEVQNEVYFKCTFFFWEVHVKYTWSILKVYLISTRESIICLVGLSCVCMSNNPWHWFVLAGISREVSFVQFGKIKGSDEVFSNEKGSSFNPLSPNGVQHQYSPNSIHTL